MKRITLCAIGLALAAGAAQAQPPSGRWFVLHEEKAKPSQVALYESTTREFVELVRANKAAMPSFYFTVMQGDDFTYTFVAPIENFASMDAINREFGALMLAAGFKFGDVMQRGAPAMESRSEMVVGEEPSMSYEPATPGLQMTDPEAKFFHYTIYYVMPGKEQEAAAIGKAYSALFKSKNVDRGYKIYWAINGPDLPALAVQRWGKDEADFYAHEAATRALLGDAVKPLDARALAVTRRMESKSARVRPDLSVRPEPAAAFK